MKRLHDTNINTVTYVLGSNGKGKAKRNVLERQLEKAGFEIQGSKVYSTDFWAMPDFKPVIATFFERDEDTLFTVHHTDYWQRENNREEKYGSRINEVPDSVLLGQSDDVFRILDKFRINPQTL